MGLNRLLVGGAVVGLVVVRRWLARSGGFDFEKVIERMPENAPPKWMFRNISAIRTNTERILNLMDAEHLPTSREVQTAA
jgi:hypothetical protein